jgi:LEA14-like dessication related protein
MKRFLKVFLIIIVILIAGALAYFYFYPKKAQNILIPDIDQVENINIRFKGDTAILDLALRMENKGFMKMNIDSLEYHVMFDTLNVLSKIQDLDIVLRPGDADTVHFPVKVPFTRLLARIKKIQERDSADITTEARVVFKSIFGHVSLPHKKRHRIGMPRPPKFELEELEYIRREKRDLFFDAHLKMHNYGNIDLVIYDIKYDVKVKDLFIASGTYPEKITVKPRSTITKTIPVKVEMKKFLKTAFLVFTDNDKVSYHAVITAVVDAEGLGDEPATVHVVKDGITELKK